MDTKWRWIVGLILLLSGCAHPYYSGTTAQHLFSIPCDNNNCGKQAFDK